MNQREEMIPGKELTPHYVIHLMLVTVTNQNPPQKYKRMSAFIPAKYYIYSSIYDHCFGEKSWGKIADILKRKWPK